MSGSRWSGALVAAASLFIGFEAHAGVPECNNLRIEADAECHVELSGSCDLACSADIYQKACATELHTVCRSECTIEPTAECLDTADWCVDLCGVEADLTCAHDCFDECAGGCQAECAGSDDLPQCRAICEATCDADCDHQCGSVGDGDPCFKHCMECMAGTCNAQANWKCQETCQEEEFESCEQECRIECSGSCEGDGALFCDGEYIISGSDVPDCVDALVELGLQMLPDLDGDGKPDVDLDGDDPDVEYDDGHVDVDWCGLAYGECPFRETDDDQPDGCSCSTDDRHHAGWLGFTVFGLLALRRRR